VVTVYLRPTALPCLKILSLCQCCVTFVIQQLRFLCCLFYYQVKHCAYCPSEFEIVGGSGYPDLRYQMRLQYARLSRLISFQRWWCLFVPCCVSLWVSVALCNVYIIASSKQKSTILVKKKPSFSALLGLRAGCWGFLSEKPVACIQVGYTCERGD